MKGLIKTLVVLAVIAVVMMLTCPNEEKHVDKVTKELVKDYQRSNDEESLLGLIGNAIAGTVGDQVVRPIVNSQLIVDDYALVTVGKIKYKGDEHMVTLGMFGHVFYLPNFRSQSSD